MYSVTAENLTKTYRTRVKQPGLRAAFRALVRPEYREVQAVRGIDLQVEQGQRLAFIGPNGAGKSTTIKMMTGILSPTSGALSVLGLSPMENRRELSRHIGTVFGQKCRRRTASSCWGPFTTLTAPLWKSAQPGCGINSAWGIFSTPRCAGFPWASAFAARWRLR